MVDLIDTIVYAGRLKDKSALMSSSSGGAFTALSDFFLKNGNAVVAAVYNYENHTAEFQMIRDDLMPYIFALIMRKIAIECVAQNISRVN